MTVSPLRMRLVSSCLIAAFCLISSATAEDNLSREIAKFIDSKLKLKRGLALDLGCGDAAIAIELAHLTDLKIECLDSSTVVVDAARARIDAAGVYGTKVTAHLHALDSLPYPSCSAALVFCGDRFSEDRRGRNLAELFRVLSPNGVGIVGQEQSAANRQPLTRQQLEGWLRDAGIASYEIFEENGVWACFTRPFEKGWDEWPQRAHDAANTFGSNDAIAGSAFRLKWISDYLPGLSSASVAIGGGKVIYASLSYKQAPERTPYLQALDAFSGVELWSRKGLKDLPLTRTPGVYSNRESSCDIVLTGDDLYLLGEKFCHLFDATTGVQRHAWPIPAEATPAEDDVWLYLSQAGNSLFAGIGKSPAVKVDCHTMYYRGISRCILALAPATGQVRWASCVPAVTSSIAVGDGKLFFCDAELKLHALDSGTGKELWTVALPYEPGSQIARCSYYRGKLWVLYNPAKLDSAGKPQLPADLLTNGPGERRVDCFSASNGTHLVKCDFGHPIACLSFAGDLVFGAGYHSGTGTTALSVESGQPLWKRMDWVACTPSLATPNCLLQRAVGMTAVWDLRDLTKPAAKQKPVTFSGVRGSCSYPALPAYGHLYIQGEGCACPSQLRANLGLVPSAETTTPFAGPRLVEGPAFKAAPKNEAPSLGWPTWRQDNQRSGQTAEEPTLPLKQLWSVPLGGQAVPATSAEGLVFGVVGNQKVVGLSAATGRQQWQYLTEGQVVASPYIWNGRLYLGDLAGWAYCLETGSGREIWRFKAALADECIVGFERYISRWPVRTGVLVEGNTAYFAAGLFPNDRVVVYALDALTGKELWQKLVVAGEGRSGCFQKAFAPCGEMALLGRQLLIPNNEGTPSRLELDAPEHTLKLVVPPKKGDPGRRGRQITVFDDEVLGVTPGLEYVWHARYMTDETNYPLPVITSDTVYLANQNGYLLAAKRANYTLGGLRISKFRLKPDSAKLPPETVRHWLAWKDKPMTAMIKAGAILFSGGSGQVYATAVSDGKELWSGAVPGSVKDLSFSNGRLVVVTQTHLVCFGQ